MVLFLKFESAAHSDELFQLAFADVPPTVVPLFTQGCVVPPYPGLLIFYPFRVWFSILGVMAFQYLNYFNKKIGE